MDENGFECCQCWESQSHIHRKTKCVECGCEYYTDGEFDDLNCIKCGRAIRDNKDNTNNKTIVRDIIIRNCPECNSNKLINNYGEIYCNDCGLVISDYGMMERIIDSREVRNIDSMKSKSTLGTDTIEIESKLRDDKKRLEWIEPDRRPKFDSESGAEAGKIGGTISRRKLESEEAKRMAKIRWETNEECAE